MGRWSLGGAIGVALAGIFSVGVAFAQTEGAHAISHATLPCFQTVIEVDLELMRLVREGKEYFVSRSKEEGLSEYPDYLRDLQESDLGLGELKPDTDQSARDLIFSRHPMLFQKVLNVADRVLGENFFPSDLEKTVLELKYEEGRRAADRKREGDLEDHANNFDYLINELELFRVRLELAKIYAPVLQRFRVPLFAPFKVFDAAAGRADPFRAIRTLDRFQVARTSFWRGRVLPVHTPGVEYLTEKFTKHEGDFLPLGLPQPRTLVDYWKMALHLMRSSDPETITVRGWNEQHQQWRVRKFDPRTSLMVVVRERDGFFLSFYPLHPKTDAYPQGYDPVGGAPLQRFMGIDSYGPDRE